MIQKQNLNENAASVKHNHPVKSSAFGFKAESLNQAFYSF